MNILMSNIALERPAGSEVWTYIVAKKLSEKGHNINVYTKKPGSFAKLFTFASVLSKPPTTSFLKGKETLVPYDLAIMNHMSCAVACAKTCVFGNRIRVIHGVQSMEERPYDWEFSKLAAISPELADYTKMTYGVEPDNIIANPVDPALFNILLDEASNTLFWGGHKLGSRTPPVWLRQDKPHTIKNVIYYSGQDYPTVWMYEKARVVVGEGRSVYQAMAAGVPAIISNGYVTTGLLTPEKYERAAYYNCTVRCREHNPRPLTPQLLNDLVDEAIGMSYEDRSWLQGKAAEVNSVEAVVSSLFDMAEVPKHQRSCVKKNEEDKVI